MAMVKAKPRNTTPSTAPIISAECNLSIGSKKVAWRPLAILLRILKPTPAVARAITLTKNSLPGLYTACFSANAFELIGQVPFWVIYQQTSKTLQKSVGLRLHDLRTVCQTRGRKGREYCRKPQSVKLI